MSMSVDLESFARSYAEDSSKITPEQMNYVFGTAIKDIAIPAAQVIAGLVRTCPEAFNYLKEAAEGNAANPRQDLKATALATTVYGEGSFDKQAVEAGRSLFGLELVIDVIRGNYSETKFPNISRDGFTNLQGEFLKVLGEGKENLYAILYHMMVNDLGKVFKLVEAVGKTEEGIQALNALQHDPRLGQMIKSSPELFAGFRQNLSSVHRENFSIALESEFLMAQLIQGESTIKQIAKILQLNPQALLNHVWAEFFDAISATGHLFQDKTVILSTAYYDCFRQLRDNLLEVKAQGASVQSAETMYRAYFNFRCDMAKVSPEALQEAGVDKLVFGRILAGARVYDEKNAQLWLDAYKNLSVEQKAQISSSLGSFAHTLYYLPDGALTPACDLKLKLENLAEFLSTAKADEHGVIDFRPCKTMLDTKIAAAKKAAEAAQPTTPVAGAAASAAASAAAGQSK